MKIPTSLTVGLAAVALVAGGGAAIAAGQPSTDTAGSADTTATAEATAEATATPGKRVHGFGGLLHSESVVSDGKGGYVTRLTQIGTVESVDADRLTVVSEDGYKRSWARNSDTAVGGAGWSVTKNDDGSWTVKKDTGELATGDEVMVAGTLAKGADTATADRITTVPKAGAIPGTILKRLDGDLGGRPGGLTDLRDRLKQRFEGGPGLGSGFEDRGEVRRFEMRTPDRSRAPQAVPAPGTAEAPDRAPSSGAVPAEPSWSTSPASFT
ncbi:hypothetical protein GCM10009547_46800 [Sporichthya brevicatena]|uniref:DUF5666 domain-containing protein n=1 Tax=Sporichthya brevicatena TaxID=171442 RepID=A0ABN1HBP4_9ACTN